MGRPQCTYVHTGKFGEHVVVYAVIQAPQSTDQGKTINWIPVCQDHWDSWWDGADWGPLEGRTIKAPEHTGNPTKVRVFFEDNHWAIDGVDDDENFTEAVWDSWDGGEHFQTLEEALEHTEEFAAQYVRPGAPVVIQQQPRVDPAFMKEARDELASMLDDLRFE